MNRLRNITPPSQAAAAASAERWNSIAKPLGSLGLLEKQVSQIAGIIGSPDVRLDRRAVVVMCADNGVVEEGVTQSDSSVTAIVAKAIANGTSNINAMSNQFNAQVIAVDVGMNTEVEGVLPRKTARGTGNIAKGAAMTIEQAEFALRAGMDIVKDLAAKGVQIIVTGEMGIGNTTTSAAISSVLLNRPVEEMTGRGAGLDSAGLSRKISAIKRAVEINKPDPAKPLELLSKLGGFDIAGMTGLFLGGAVYHVPIVIDGVISAAAAALAVAIAPDCAGYMLPSHVSKEPAGQALLERLGLHAPIQAELRLGEGTGGVLLLPMLDGALAVYNGSHKFDELPMERYTELI
ncbi:MAG: nicotinate-nucleotide--dimethylbenzimidazole phosphoribosyltransferase [Oscillospiraceae bacterium]